MRIILLLFLLYATPVFADYDPNGWQTFKYDWQKLPSGAYYLAHTEYYVVKSDLDGMYELHNGSASIIFRANNWENIQLELFKRIKEAFYNGELPLQKPNYENFDE